MFRYISQILFAIGLLVSAVSAYDLKVIGVPTVRYKGMDYNMNGQYLAVGQFNGRTFWKSEYSEAYIYFENYQGADYWFIDNNKLSDTVFFYSNDVPAVASPEFVVSWSTEADPNANPATILVSKVQDVPVPEIVLQGNNSLVSDGSTDISFTNHTNFGSVDVTSGTITRTYRIQNTGSADLKITSIALSGTNLTDFTLLSMPATPIAPNGSSTFSVQFNPSAVGNRTARISIDNSDSDESPYEFSIQGYGYYPSNIQVSGITKPATANGLYVHQGVRNGFEYWKHETEEFYLETDVANSLNFWIISNKLTGTYGDCMWNKSSNAVTPIALTGWVSSNATNYQGTPTIAAVAAVPDMVVYGNNSAPILDKDAIPRIWDGTNFGSVNVVSGISSRTFTIQNVGGSVLNLTGTSPFVSIEGDPAGDFSISSPPTSSIGINEVASFTVTFNPSAVGTRTAILVINNNDPNEGSYSFNIKGEGYEPKALIVSGITGTTQANGRYVLQGTQNEYQYWKHESAAYYLYNAEYSLNRYWFIDSDLNSTAFVLRSSSLNEEAYPAGISGWNFSAGNGGTVTIQFAATEIALIGNTLNIVDGDGTPSTADHTDFGNVDITDGEVTRTFTVKNVGTDPLNLTGSPVVSVMGYKAFSVTVQPASTIAPGASTTFNVKFDPTLLGAQTAVVSIANNDSDENPFNFLIAGIAVETPPAVEIQNATSIGKTSAQVEGKLVSAGSYAVTQHGFCWNTAGTPTIENSTCSQSGTIAVGSSFNTVLSSLIPGTAYYVRSYATSPAGTAYSVETSFTTIANLLSVPANSLSFVKGSNLVDVSVNANVNWTVSSDATWLTTDVSSGSNDGMVSISAPANPSVQDRVGHITLSCTELPDQVIEVTQAAGDPVLSVSANTLALGNGKVAGSIQVTTNTTWSAQSSETWLSLSAPDYTTGSQLTITPVANPKQIARSASVTVSVQGLPDEVIAVTQAAAAPSLEVSKTSISFANPAGQGSFDVTSNGEWSALAGASWVTLTTDAGIDNGTIAFQVQANTSSSARSTTIKVSMDGISDRTVTIQQAASPPRAPVLVSVKTGLSTQEDNAFTFAMSHVVATDADGDNLTLVVGTGSHYTVKGLVVTPEKNYFGKLSIPLTVSDGALVSNSKTAELTVTSVNDKPIVRDTLITASGSFTVNLAQLGSDVEGDIASVSVEKSPKNGTAVLTGTSLKYTPKKDFVGKDTIVWYAVDEDGEKSVSATLAIQITKSTPVLAGELQRESILRILGRNPEEFRVEMVVPQGISWELSLENILGQIKTLDRGVGLGLKQDVQLDLAAIPSGIQYLVLKTNGRVYHRIPLTWR